MAQAEDAIPKGHSLQGIPTNNTALRVRKATGTMMHDDDRPSRWIRGSRLRRVTKNRRRRTMTIFVSATCRDNISTRSRSAPTSHLPRHPHRCDAKGYISMTARIPPTNRPSPGTTAANAHTNEGTHTSRRLQSPEETVSARPRLDQGPYPPQRGPLKIVLHTKRVFTSRAGPRRRRWCNAPANEVVVHGLPTPRRRATAMDDDRKRRG